MKKLERIADVTIQRNEKMYAAERRKTMAGEKNKKRKPLWLKILLVFFLLILLLLAGGYLLLNHYLSKMQYIPDETKTYGESNGEFAWETEETVEGTNSPQEEIDQANQELESFLAEMEMPSQSRSGNVTNILLIGVDRRDGSWNGNSDSMILVSINKDAKKVILTSIMRDTYVAIPGVKNYKINHAMAVGGASLLLETVRQNFKVQVDYYACVDFNAFIKVVDVFGTIPIQMTQAEIDTFGSQLDKFQREGNVYYIDSAFALSYARNRWIGRWDYERTERQRKIILSVIGELKNSGLSEINQLADAVLPNISHNIPQTELLMLLMDAVSYLNYDMVSSRIPYDGMYQGMTIEGQGMLVPDWPATINNLHNIIYGQ